MFAAKLSPFISKIQKKKTKKITDFNNINVDGIMSLPQQNVVGSSKNISERRPYAF